MKYLYILLVLSACATTGAYKKTLDGWLGKDVSQFISSSGVPDATHKLPNGNTVYEFRRSGVSGSAYGISSYYCNTRIIAEPSGKIVDWSFDGNACKS